MVSQIKVNEIIKQSGSSITIGESGDTISIPSGATIANSGTATGFGANSKLFYAYLNSNQDTLQNNTFVKVNMGHEVFDVDSVYDTSSYKYIPASTGYYYLNAGVKIRQLNTYMREVGIAIYKNGSMIMREIQMFGTSDIIGNDYSVTVNSVHNSASTSDYFEVYAFYNTGSGSNNYRATAEQEMTYFTGYKLIT